MIPLTLQIKNFLSYGSPTQTIDFSHHQVICLSGKNGHGKSALLDALVWALWGQARKVSGVAKPDEHLLRMGQNHMVVVFDFMCGGQHYCVRREYTHVSGKVQTTLDFGMVTPSGMKSLTDKTIRATQSRIDDVVGLDYEGCINSIFLRQGQANEFSKKAPKERKEILTSMLGFAHFELMRKKATELMRTYVTQREAAARTLTHAREQTAPYTSLCEQLRLLSVQRDELVAQEQRIIQQTTELAEKLHLQRSEIQVAQGRVERLAAGEQRIAVLRIQVGDLVRHIRMVRAAYRVERIGAQRRVQRQQELAHALAQCEQLLTQKLAYTQALSAAQTAEQAYVRTRERTLQQQYAVDEQAYAVHAATVRNLTEQQDKIARELAEHRLHIQALPPRLCVPRTRTIVDRMRMRLQQAEQRMHRLQLRDVHQVYVAGSRCETCFQDISESIFDRMREQASVRMGRLGRHIARLKRVITSTTARLHHEEALEKRVATAVVASQQLELQQQEVQKSLASAYARTQELRIARDTAQAACTQWEQRDEQRCALATKVAQLTAQVQLCAYDATQHALLREQWDACVLQERAYNETIAAYAAHHEKRAHLRLLIKEIRGLMQEVGTLRDAATIYAHVRGVHDELVQQERVLMAQQREQRVQLDRVAAEIGSVSKHVELCMQALRTSEQLEQEVAAATHLAEEYQLVGQALGKEGIQALLIEQMIPEVEREANALLARLTDNQAHLAIESIRDLKQGGTRETLDIKISDAQGVRPYELFSGGEAFRIDFALRVALSKILAHRSGRPLQTLIIDEGFGSQDDEGIAHIMDAIDRIKDDFAKIFIVSHLPVVKDQFAVHYIVHKGPMGSSVRVIEHG